MFLKLLSCGYRFMVSKLCVVLGLEGLSAANVKMGLCKGFIKFYKYYVVYMSTVRVL